MRILIAEDESTSLHMLRSTLEKWEHDVVATVNGTEAWQVLQREDAPALAILDWMMPGMNGTEVCQKIRELPDGQSTYVILLTSKTQKEDMISGFQAGADDYITKPFSHQELRERVQVGIRIVELQRKLAGHVAELNDALSQVSRAEKVIREANAEKEELLESISSLLISVDQDGCITYWNAVAEATFGITPADVVGRPFSECGIGWDWDIVTNSIEDCLKGSELVYLHDIRYRQPEGRDGFLSISVNPIIGDTTSRPGFLLLLEDITERKILESQLRQAQRSESIGQLAEGIAHELNTPIHYLHNNTLFVQEAFADISAVLGKYGQLLAMAKSGPIPSQLIAEVESVVDKADMEYCVK